MALLKIAKRNVHGYQREIVPFLGLNRSDDVKEGEFTEQTNMSARRYPFLAPRLSRQKEAAMDGADALFYWDGHEVVAANGTLYFDGNALCNVSAGPKQFAVVNTALVVWPDKLKVDITAGTVSPLSDRTVNVGQAVFTTDKLTLLPKTVYAKTTLRYRSSDSRVPWLWSYASVRWTEDGGWECEDGRWLRAQSTVGRCCIPAVSELSIGGRYAAQTPKAVYGNSAPTAPGQPDNDLGFYTRITHLDGFSQTADSYYADLAAEIYWEAQNAQSLDTLFRAGDVVSVTGTLYGLLDVEKRIVRAIDPDTNTLTFDPDTFLPGDAAGQVGRDVDETICLRYTVGETTHRYRVKDFTALAGQRVVLDINAGYARVFREDGTVVKSFSADVTSSTTGYPVLEMTGLRSTDLAFEVFRPVPEIAYICSHENRLWGVSNEDRTIYASALGDPSNFFVYDGLSTDSYAVAVGSEGAFTGICSFGGAVLCWKERRLHKVLGDLPENYQTAEYSFSGVRDGAHKSLVNINEMLFYLGVDGVYSYAGNKPTLISKPLGNTVLRNGVGGTDGRAYYLSAQNGEKWELLSFDTHSGLWNRSDETQVVDFGRTDNVVKFLSGEHLYTIGAGDEAVEWEAVFVPVYETLDASKQYRRLIFRAEVPKGSWMAADVRYDDGRWMQVGIVKGITGPVRMPVPIRRCDKFQIRLRGVGDCAVLDMAREFRLRGDR